MENDDGDGSVFDLKAEDSDLLNYVRKPYQDSENYWNTKEGFNLKDVREKT